MRVLITGGYGFIGKRLVRYLVDRGVRVTILDHDKSAERCFQQQFRNLSPEVCSLLRHDVRQPIGPHLVDGVDMIVHLAAESGVQQSIAEPRKSFETNVLGTFNVLELARKIGARKIILASSGAVAGGESSGGFGKNLLHPYAADKACVEALGMSQRNCFGMDITAVRFSNVYGPGSEAKTSVVARMIREGFEGKITINGNGLQARDFIHVDDICGLLTKILMANARGLPVLNLCSGIFCEINDLAHRIKRYLEELTTADPKIEFGPALKADIERPARDLGYDLELNGITHSFLDFDDGLRETVKYLTGDNKAL